jgi:hypothetical protein
LENPVHNNREFTTIGNNEINAHIDPFKIHYLALKTLPIETAAIFNAHYH